MLKENISMKTELNEKIKKALLKELTIKANVKILNIIGKGGMGEIYNAQFGKYLIAMKIIYKKAAIDDLLNTENYIINQFHNDQAAKKLKNNIVDTISLLKDNPYLGPKMSDRFDIDTPFR